MAARGRGKKRAPRRKKAAIGILNVSESLFQGSLITKLAFNLNPVEFLLGDSGVAGITSAGGTSLTELVKDPSQPQYHDSPCPGGEVVGWHLT